MTKFDNIFGGSSLIQTALIAEYTGLRLIQLK